MEGRWTKGLFTLCALVLVVLKLGGHIGWSWVVVTAPVWLPAAVAVSLRLAAVAVLGGVAYLLWTGGELSRLPEVLEGIPLIGQLPWEELL